MLLPVLLLLWAASALAQSSTSSSGVVLSGTHSVNYDLDSGTPTYASYPSTRTLSSSSSSSMSSSNATASGNSSSTSTEAFPTRLVGTNVRNGTATGTATSASPTNTQPCNGWAEFCDRPYSNITYIGAHNSPFVQPNNAASNQDFRVFSQLNDGIRMLQFQVHLYEGELRLCHSNCQILNSGTLEEYLTNATMWLDAHPYEVVTILLGNSDRLTPGNYTAPIEKSGIRDLLYTPPKVPMGIDDWPTLGEMILARTRVVLLMDYDANTTAVPYVLDEFANVWETPFSPTNNSFPCTQDRPPGLSNQDASDRMYMANHNLNVNIDLLGLQIDVPNTVSIDSTNSDLLDPVGTAARNIQNCTKEWNRPPNFLLVDYYNRGNYNGSVFAAAAAANNVDYNPDGCCGKNDNANAAPSRRPNFGPLGLVVLVAAMLL